MRLKFIFLCTILLLLPAASPFTAVVLNAGNNLPAQSIEGRQLSKNEKKRLARTKRWKHRQARKIEKSEQRKRDTLWGILGILAALPFPLFLFNTVSLTFILLWVLGFLMTAFVGILFLINGTGDREITFLNWAKFRHFALGWLLFILTGYAAVILFVVTFTLGFDGGGFLVNVIGFLSFLTAAVALFFLLRGIVRALIPD